MNVCFNIYFLQERVLYLLGLFYWTWSAQNIPIKVQLICWFWVDSYEFPLDDGKNFR